MQPFMFIIRHGPETVPEQRAIPVGEERHFSTVPPRRQSGPAVPPRRSSKSILRYVSTKYTDGSSEADYSSTTSFSLNASMPAHNTRGQAPLRRHLPDLDRRRAEHNDALRPLEREITSTYRSGAWSFETPSEVSSSSRRALPTLPLNATDSPMERQLPDNAATRGSSTNRAMHIQQPSVDTEVTLQVFKKITVDVGNHETGQTDPPFPERPVLAPTTQGSDASVPHEMLPAILTTGRSSEHHTVAMSPQHNVPAPKNLATSLWSDLSRWSDEYDQFPEAQQESGVEQMRPRADTLDRTNDQLPEPDHCPRVNSRTSTERYVGDNHHGIETPTETLSAASEITIAPAVRTWLEHTLEALEVAAESYRYASSDPADSLGSVRSQLHEEGSTTPIQSPPQTVTRELLPIGVANQNAQIALVSLTQILEPFHQLIFEEQSRTEGLRVVVNENIVLRQELQFAHQAIVERDGEIARLRVREGRMRGQAMPLLTSSFVYRSTSSPVDGLESQDERLQESSDGQDAVSDFDGPATAIEIPNREVPRPRARRPMLDHGANDQRTIPRVRPAWPTRGRQHFSINGDDAEKDLDEE